ncbi:hypothetical protein DVH24_035580 [Malus domestica]|uniref:Uncharacterized protein n=1 Tax=Malus domestica TaxID=3750 RepID=A0A498JTN8_MALDO|nr:hypothetical protein DVH24_035580 [Malus domestica]
MSESLAFCESRNLFRLSWPCRSIFLLTWYTISHSETLLRALLYLCLLSHMKFKIPVSISFDAYHHLIFGMYNPCGCFTKSVRIISIK